MARTRSLLGQPHRRQRFRRALPALVASMAAVQLVPAGGAGAATVLTSIACGQLVTTDVKLTSDVGPCPGIGFEIVSADGLTIDLNGHSVIGPSDLDAGDTTGIRIAGVRNLTIKNGAITGFATGIEANSYQGGLLSRLWVHDNRGGLVETPGVVEHVGSGITLRFASDLMIRENRVQGNGPIAGIRLSNSWNTVIESNVVQGNNVRNLTSTLAPNIVTQQTRGVWVGSSFRPGFPGGNVVRGNTIANNGWHGVSVTGFPTGNQVVRNSVHGNGLDQPIDERGIPYGDGIHVDAPGVLVQGNTVTFNGANGIHVLRSGNQIVSNSAVRNAQRPGPVFQKWDLTDRIPDCAGNVWQGNRYRTANQPCVTA